MTPERYEAIRRIFDEVCDLPEGERDAAIDHACAGDDELAAEVRALLAHDAGPSSGGPEAFDLDVEAADEELPDRIGQYRIVRRIGAGGMGVVYEAEQNEPRRRVAIKILRADPAVTGSMKRFQREVHVLGLLQHSGIAQVYDAGKIETSAGARAYFAMEHVEGEPILAYARRRELSFQDRLELVRRLCDAVQHAHTRGVVHRDLKPSNILVMADGQPKILDFGVARLTDPEGRGTSLHTQVGQLIGTLPYMSPEQASGVPDAVDTRSDVYALGILLYELLAARPPYDLAGKMMHEALRVIQEDEPESLSRIERSLRGDVDTIVATALAKDKSRRYQTASALSDDIRRFLSNEPITARPPSAMYHFGKLVRRHRVATALVAALVIVSVAFGVIGTLQAGQLRDASIEIARESEEKSRRLYASQIAQANFLRRDFNVGQMDEVLEACEEERRGWEWRWLKAQVKPYRLEIRTEFSQLLTAGVWRQDLLVVGTDGEFVVGRCLKRDEEVFRWKAGDIVASTVRLSSTCSLLAAGDRTGVIRVWRVPSGDLLLEEHVFWGPVGSSVFSPDESAIAVASHGKAVIDKQEFTQILVLELDEEQYISGIMSPAPTIAMAFDRRARWLVVGQMSGEIRTFRRRTGVQQTFEPMDVAQVEPPLLAVSCLDDDRIAISHHDRVTLLDRGLGVEQVLRGTHAEAVGGLAVSGSGLVATTDRDGKLIVQSIRTGNPVFHAAAHDHEASQVSFMPNEEWVFTWAHDNRLRIWFTSEGGGHAPNLSAVESELAVLDPQRSIVVAALEDGRGLVARRLQGGEELARVSLPSAAICGVYQSSAHRVVVATRDGQLLGWDGGSQQPEELSVFGEPITELLVGHGGRYLVALSGGRLSCLDQSGKIVASANSPVVGAAACHEGIVIAVGAGGLLHEFQLPSLELRRTLELQLGDVEMMEIDRLGEFVALATRDNGLTCVSLRSGELLSKISVRMPITSIAWLPDGSRVLTGGEDRVVRMWDPTSGDMLISWAVAGTRVTQIWVLNDGLVARYAPGGIAEWTTARSSNRRGVLDACLRSESADPDGVRRVFWEPETPESD